MAVESPLIEGHWGRDLGEGVLGKDWEGAEKDCVPQVETLMTALVRR